HRRALADLRAVRPVRAGRSAAAAQRPDDRLSGVLGRGPAAVPAALRAHRPRRPRPASPPRRAGRPAQVRPPSGIAPPQVPVLVLPDGPARASVLPYDVLRRSLAGRGLDVLMMEHRGVGLSRLDSTGRDLPAHAMSLREVIGDLVAVLDHARVEQVAVVGSGYGAYL